MIETILGKVGIPLLISLLKETLGGMNSPVAKGASEALGQVDVALKTGQISGEQIAEANRHLEALEALKSEELKATISEINQTIRAEITSEDIYVRRMRPTFGYLVALTWAAQMLGIAYIIVFETHRAGEVMASFASLSAIWGIGLSVLGIYVYKRSDDKKVSGKEMIFWKN